MLYSLSAQREGNERKPGLLWYIQDFATHCEIQQQQRHKGKVPSDSKTQGICHHKQTRTGFVLTQPSHCFWRTLLFQTAQQESFILLTRPEIFCTELQLSILALVLLSAMNILHLPCMQFIFPDSSGSSSHSSRQAMGIILLLYSSHLRCPYSTNPKCKWVEVSDCWKQTSQSRRV